jgi:hypothetical protein
MLFARRIAFGIREIPLRIRRISSAARATPIAVFINCFSDLQGPLKRQLNQAGRNALQ